MEKQDLNRREFLAYSGSAMIAAAVGLTAQGCHPRNKSQTGEDLKSAQPISKPNIIFILADDLGYGDIGCYGQKVIRTPNIDRMAEQGIRFTQCYAGSTVCAPSRCSLMTGMHTGHATIRGNLQKALPLRKEDVTVAEVLKSAGYATGAIGKWGLGLEDSTGTPDKKGFDEFFGYINQTLAHSYYPEYLWRNNEKVILEGNQSGRKTQYSHDLFEKEALDFISRHRSEPFFLYLALTTPHANNELGEETGNGMEIPDYGRYEKENWPLPEKGFAAMVTRMDNTVGTIMKKLKDSGIDENTIVFFSSDNGPHNEGGYHPQFFNSSGPLRGIKHDLYEGGIRVPMIARWPGHIKNGLVSNQVWAFWDFLPTAAQIANAEIPPGIDGISMLPSLLGKSQQAHEYLYWELFERAWEENGGLFSQALLMDNWKAIRNGRGNSIELYNLKDDLAERKNIADQHPETVEKINAMMKSVRVDSSFFHI